MNEEPISISVGTAEEGDGYIGIIIISGLPGHYQTRPVRTTREEARQDAQALHDKLKVYVQAKARADGYEVEFTPHTLQ